MSGSITANYSQLFGGGGGYAGLNPAFPTYLRLLKSGQQDYRAFAAQPSIQANVAYIQAALAKVKTPADLVKDTKLLNFVLTAFNLQGDAAYAGRIKAVLASNLKDPASLANQLRDPRYQQLAKFFNFYVLQGRNLGLKSLAQDLTNRYTQSAYEIQLGQQNQALRAASYFVQNIGNVTDVTQILGDPVLRQVVVTALGLPDSLVRAPIDQQIALLKRKLNLSQLTGKASAASGGNPSTLANATADLAQLGKLGKALAAALTPVQSIAGQAKTLLASYANLATITSTTGPYGSEIPTQQAAVPGLGRQQGLLTAASQAAGAITTLTQSMSAAITQAQAGGLTPAQLTALQQQFSSQNTQANTLTTQATFGGENLIDGSIAAPIQVTIKASNGQKTVVNPYNFNTGVLNNLASANTAFQAGNYASARSFLVAAQTSLGGATQQLGIDTQNFNSGIKSVPQWAVTEHAGNLNAASQTIASARTAYGSINSLTQQILNLAQQAASSGLPNNHPQLIAYDTQYQALVTQLKNAITGAAYSGQNLLDGTPILIGSSATAGRVDIGNVLRTDGTTTPAAQLSIDGLNLRQYAGGGGANDLFTRNLTTTANAQAVVTYVNNTVNPSVLQANRVLANNGDVFTLVGQTLDPRSALDNKYRALVTSATSQLATANALAGSLIAPTATNLTASVTTTGSTVIAHADPGFVANVQNTLTSGGALLYSNFSQALQSLADASFFANNRLGALKSDQTIVNFQTKLANNVKDAATPSTKNSGAFAPFGSRNSFVQQFVARFLLLSDAKGSSVGPTGPGSTALQLLTGSRP